MWIQERQKKSLLTSEVNIPLSWLSIVNEFVRAVNTIRKSKDFGIAQEINLDAFDLSARQYSALLCETSWIKEECLILNLRLYRKEENILFRGYDLHSFELNDFEIYPTKEHWNIIQINVS